MAASYAVSESEKARVCLARTMQRMRQMELLLLARELDVRMFGNSSALEAYFQGVDIFRWSTISRNSLPLRSTLWRYNDKVPQLGTFLPFADTKKRSE